MEMVIMHITIGGTGLCINVLRVGYFKVMKIFRVKPKGFAPTIDIIWSWAHYINLPFEVV